MRSDWLYKAFTLTAFLAYMTLSIIEGGIPMAFIYIIGAFSGAAVHVAFAQR